MCSVHFLQLLELQHKKEKKNIQACLFWNQLQENERSFLWVKFNCYLAVTCWLPIKIETWNDCNSFALSYIWYQFKVFDLKNLLLLVMSTFLLIECCYYSYTTLNPKDLQIAITYFDQIPHPSLCTIHVMLSMRISCSLKINLSW